MAPYLFSYFRSQFLYGGLENGTFCMWGSWNCHLLYVRDVGVSKSPCYVRVSKMPCPWYIRVSKNIIPFPFPFFIWIALIHNLENKSILRVFVLFTFVMILVHFIWVFGPFLCILNFFLVFTFAASADTSV